MLLPAPLGPARADPLPRPGLDPRALEHRRVGVGEVHVAQLEPAPVVDPPRSLVGRRLRRREDLLEALQRLPAGDHLRYGRDQLRRLGAQDAEQGIEGDQRPQRRAVVGDGGATDDQDDDRGDRGERAVDLPVQRLQPRHREPVRAEPADLLVGGALLGVLGGMGGDQVTPPEREVHAGAVAVEGLLPGAGPGHDPGAEATADEEHQRPGHGEDREQEGVDDDQGHRERRADDRRRGGLPGERVRHHVDALAVLDDDRVHP